jgi:hypothetical protein
MTEEIEVVEDGELVEAEEEHGVMVVRGERPGGSMSLFGTDDPAEVVKKASAVATALADVIEQRSLYKAISGKKHVFVEGWTLLGSMLGVFPVLESCEPYTTDEGVKGYRAIVTAQTTAGNVIGRASAVCMRNESRWSNADEYAISSMAQTRATSKCLRAPLGFVMQLAGFEATPEAEMPEGGFTSSGSAAPRTPAAKPLNELLLKRLMEGIDKLSGKPGWGRDEVVATAAQTYKRPIAKLTDLTDTEASQIIEAMKTYGGVEV